MLFARPSQPYFFPRAQPAARPARTFNWAITWRIFSTRREGEQRVSAPWSGFAKANVHWKRQATCTSPVVQGAWRVLKRSYNREGGSRSQQRKARGVARRDWFLELDFLSPGGVSTKRRPESWTAFTWCWCPCYTARTRWSVIAPFADKYANRLRLFFKTQTAIPLTSMPSRSHDK